MHSCLIVPGMCLGSDEAMLDDPSIYPRWHSGPHAYNTIYVPPSQYSVLLVSFSKYISIEVYCYIQQTAANTIWQHKLAFSYSENWRYMCQRVDFRRDRVEQCGIILGGKRATKRIDTISQLKFISSFSSFPQQSSIIIVAIFHCSVFHPTNSLVIWITSVRLVVIAEKTNDPQTPLAMLPFSRLLAYVCSSSVFMAARGTRAARLST